MEPQIDTANKFMVASKGNNRLVIMSAPHDPITHDEALLLAAYLVSMATDASHTFAEVLTAVQSQGQAQTTTG